MAGVRYSVRQVISDRADAVLSFYERHRAYEQGHVWPRTLDDLRLYAEEECLFEAVDLGDGSTIGAAYTRHDTDEQGNPRWEIGGLFLDPAHRGTDLAETLIKASIVSLYVLDPPGDEPLMGHVHELNDRPRTLLGRLGFVRNGQEKLPPEIAPTTMKRNGDGEVIGHVFVFATTKLNDFADWLEGYTGSLADGTLVELDTPVFAQNRAVTVLALRATASGEPANT